MLLMAEASVCKDWGQESNLARGPWTMGGREAESGKVDTKEGLLPTKAKSQVHLAFSH